MYIGITVEGPTCLYRSLDQLYSALKHEHPCIFAILSPTYFRYPLHGDPVTSAARKALRRLIDFFLLGNDIIQNFRKEAEGVLH